MTDFRGIRRLLTLAPWRSRGRIQRDVVDELRAHIEMRAGTLARQGMTAADALARAEREFGDIDDAVRYCADVDTHAERTRRVREG
jgi:hypothetical protein